MVMQYIDFFIDQFMPAVVDFLSNSFIVSGVSMFEFLIAIGLLCIIIGGLLIR